MNILAIDTSSKASSCALLRDGTLAGEFFANIGLTHSQTGLPMVEALLAHTRTTINEIDGFAVSVGPGSFTGLRIGVSSVKGLAFALDKPCAAVSTLWALAQNAACFRGYVAPAMDARRAQVYTALFHADGTTLRRVGEDEALSIAALGERLAALDEPVLLVGDGAALCAGQLTHLGHVRLAPERLRHQRAASVAACALELPEDGWVSAEALAPQYLRLPQAERERLEKLNHPQTDQQSKK